MGNENQAYCGKHYYNKDKYDRCPYCYGEEAQKEVGATMPQGKVNMEKEVMEATQAAFEGKAGAFRYIENEDDGERTVSAFFKEKGVDPVVGWLVAVSGAAKGHDYSIRTGNNFIGRNPNMDICIRGDMSISKENHARISFDNRNRKFYFTPGNGKNIVYINDEAVFSTTEIVSYDIIEIGVTKFVFVPFCGKDFNWDDVLKEEIETEGE